MVCINHDTNFFANLLTVLHILLASFFNIWLICNSGFRRCVYIFSVTLLIFGSFAKIHTFKRFISNLFCKSFEYLSYLQPTQTFNRFDSVESFEVSTFTGFDFDFFCKSFEYLTHLQKI